jgi:hypothetical protein
MTHKLGKKDFKSQNPSPPGKLPKEQALARLPNHSNFSH